MKSIDSRSLAPTINEVVLSRLEWLSHSASSLLSAAAVIGRNCSFRLLSRVSGTDEQNTLDALDELLSARLIGEARNQARPYNISHDRIRETVYAHLSEARREVFHRRALTALGEVKAASAELAHHALSAKEWGLAFQYSLGAGDEVMRLYEVTTAAGHYESALVGLCKILPLPYDSQDLEKAAVLAMQALPLAQTLEDLKAQGQIELSLARTHKFVDRQIESTLQHLRAAEGWARKAGVRDELAMTLLEIGVALMFSRSFGASRGDPERGDGNIPRTRSVSTGVELFA